MDNVLEMLQERHTSSGGHCGRYPQDIANELGIPLRQVFEKLNDLYKKGLITVHDGIHGKLAKLKA